ncbi:MAG TPA: CHASE2 domain-containing protein [Syntrophales bacterium]|nr:CHASE2 domain-containing protein [Syntrophales bacterium]
MKNIKTDKRRDGKFRANLKPTLALGAFLICFLAVLMAAHFFDGIEYKVLDKAFKERPPIRISPDIVTLDIDDSSLGIVGRWPWPWNVHSMVLDFLTLYGARSVTFIDIDFSRENDMHFTPEEAVRFKRNLEKDASSGAKGRSLLSDQNKLLYDSIRNNGRAFFTMSFKFPLREDELKSPLKSAEEKARLFTKEKEQNIALLRKKISISGQMGSYAEAVDIDPPLAGIMKNAAGAGFNSILPDEDGIVRRYPLIASYRGDIYPSVGLQSLMNFTKAKKMGLAKGNHVELQGEKGPMRIPINKNGEMYINWAGGYTATFMRIPFNLTASFLSLQAAKKELAAYSINAMQDPMSLQGIVTDRLRAMHILTEEQCNYTGTIAFVSFIIEYFLRNTPHPLEEILNSLGIDPRDEMWLTTGREIALNNSLVTLNFKNGKMPAFDELVKMMGYGLNEKSREQLRNSYDQTEYFINKGRVDEVRPLYFGGSLSLKIGKQEYKVSPLNFRDKAVFYGLTATGLTSQSATPFTEMHPMLDLAPNVVNTVVTGNTLIPLQHNAISFAYLIAALFMVMHLSPLTGFLAICLTALLHASAFWFAFTRHGYMLPVIPPLFSISMAYVSTLMYRYFQEQKEKKKVRGMFATMVSPEVMKIMEENPESFRLAGEQREATIFSSDVSGFTNISEGVTARELANILNIYLTPMSNIIMSYSGYVDKYEGDAIKADFGVPLSDPGHSWKACFSALYQQEELKVIQRMILLKYGVKITARMGINTGIVSAGNMGSEKRMQYTVMGEAVTIAEELEPANKLFESWIAIGPDTFRQSREAVDVRYLNNLIMGPSHQSLPVYELAGWKKDKFLDFWIGKPVSELALQSLAKMLPEKVIAYYEYYMKRDLPTSPLLDDLKKLFGELKDDAVSYIRASSAASVFYIREELSSLKDALQAHGEIGDKAPEGLAGELAKLKDQLSSEGKDWNRALLNWKKELKECAIAQSQLIGKIDKEESDQYFALIDILEKSMACIYMRITFPSPDDTVALEMADHLKDLLLEKDSAYAGESAATVKEKAKAIETGINGSLSHFAGKLKDRADEYHRLLADICVITEDTKRVFEIYGKGREHYLRKEWDEAIYAFKKALEIIPDDGPSLMFIKKIESLKNNPPPPDWNGAWEEG